MLIEYEYARNYLFTALEAAPNLYDALLLGLTDGEADFRPDPARFTLREMMAHVATWEQVLLSRLALTCDENEPTLPLFDEAPALANEYPSADPFGKSRLFRERRTALVAFLRARAPTEWGRVAHRLNVGPMTVEAQALLIPLHDTYHFDQIRQWRADFAARSSAGL